MWALFHLLVASTFQTKQSGLEEAFGQSEPFWAEAVERRVNVFLELLQIYVGITCIMTGY